MHAIIDSVKINLDALEGDLDRFLEIPANHSKLIGQSEVYRNVKYPVVITKLATNEWLAEYKDLPGCKIHGSTVEEALARLNEIKLSWIYAALADGKEIPKPTPGVPVIKVI